MKSKDSGQIKSKVEVKGIEALFYDELLQLVSLGQYGRLLRKIFSEAGLKRGAVIADFGAGTGKNELILDELYDLKRVVGYDISKVLKRRFARRMIGRGLDFCALNQRIDESFTPNEQVDYVLISFVLHGFPLEKQRIILANAFHHLKAGGEILILDYNEFDIAQMHWFSRLLFRAIECPYAFLYIKENLEEKLAAVGFSEVRHSYYGRGFLRLTHARKA